MSMTSSSSRRPFGQPARSPPSTPRRLPCPTGAVGAIAEVQPDLVRTSVTREVEVRLLQPGQQHRDEIAAVRLLERAELRIQLVEQLRQDRARVVLLELLVLVRRGRVPLVLQLGRDQHLVDERVARAARPAATPSTSARNLRPRHFASVDLHDGPLTRRPDADDVIRAVVELRQRHLQRDRVHGVAGEEVLAAAGCTGAVANRDEVEDRTDVAEEAVVTLTGEDLRAVVEIVDAGRGECAVVRRRPRPDVVGRRQQTAADDAGSAFPSTRVTVYACCVFCRNATGAPVLNRNYQVTSGLPSPFLSA